jgi:hypothetical protein
VGLGEGRNWTSFYGAKAIALQQPVRRISSVFRRLYVPTVEKADSDPGPTSPGASAIDCYTLDRNSLLLYGLGLVFQTTVLLSSGKEVKSHCCPNPECPLFQKVDAGNVVPYGF